MVPIITSSIGIDRSIVPGHTIRRGVTIVKQGMERRLLIRTIEDLRTPKVQKRKQNRDREADPCPPLVVPRVDRQPDPDRKAVS